MNLLNSRLSKGQVKHRLRKKLQEEECAVRVTEALGHQGSESYRHFNLICHSQSQGPSVLSALS